MTALIGASVLLIAASAIALVFGWITADESLIWTSIVASVGAGVTLTLAYFRSRREAAAAARGAGDADAADAGAPAREVRDSGGAGDEEEVAAVRDSKRYHRLGCRYAGAKGAQKMTKAAARKEGYSPCGICKP